MRDHIRFDTEVVSATWHDDDAAWTLVVRTADGTEDTVIAQAVVSAVGQLNRPHYPDIPGRDTFTGTAFHSARWDHDAPIDGARVAVIGTGASSVQFTPEIAPACRAPHPVPAHAAVARTVGRLPRRGLRRSEVAVRARAVVQRVEPVLDVLAHG